MGYLLTVEAPDASGKSTQIDALCERLTADGYAVRRIRFPNYGSPACKPAELYLSGALGDAPEDTGPYAASVFFAVDRYFSYRTDWKATLEQQNSVLLLDRYTTSNAIHQLAKIRDTAQRRAFLEWLYDFEFNKLALPIPDDTVFLDVPPAVSLELLSRRAQTDSTHHSDIHEANAAYLAECYEAACFAAEEKGWKRIRCTDSGKMRSIDGIHDELYAYVSARIHEKFGK